MTSSFTSPLEETQHISQALDRVISMANGKGGVGKTTATANIAGTAALGGYRVLVIDLDHQGDMKSDLGYEKQTGEELLAALITGTNPPILKDVRENLDVIAGGPALEDIAAIMAVRAGRDDSSDFGDMLYKMLAPIVGDYDLILMDTPPGDKVIVEGALCVSTAVIIPTKSDDGSVNGVERMGRRFQAVRPRNPVLQVAGVLLFAVGSRSLRLERSVREKLEGMLGEVAPVFATRIRNLESAAADARDRGLLFYELEGAAKGEKAVTLAALKAGEKPPRGMFTSNASAVAAEFEDLTGEILTRLNEIKGVQ